MLGRKVGIDLGTATVRIVVKGEGMIGSEPSVVAIRHGDFQASLFGLAALEAAAGDLELDVHHPIDGGRVAETEPARALVTHAIARAVGRQRIFKPDVVIAVMSSLPGDQRRLLLDAAATAGARTAYLLDAPIAAAMGAGIRLSGPNGHLVVDIGAGKTDVAALALEGTVSGRSLPGHGGVRLSASIADHVRQAHGVALGQPAVDDVVASLVRVGPHEERRLEVTGHSGTTERTVTLRSTELAGALDAHVRPIVTAIGEVLADTPPALVADIGVEGITLCGGGARLEGLDRHIAAAMGLDVHVDSQPHLCAVKGTGHALDNLDVLKRTLMYIR